MRKVSSRARRVLVGAAVGGLAVTVTPAAFAQISGVVVAGNGAHANRLLKVELQDSSVPPKTQSTWVSDSGTFEVKAPVTQRMVAPINVVATGEDPCLPGTLTDRRVTSPPVPVAAGATGVVVTVPLRAFCTSHTLSLTKDPTAFIDAASGQILAPTNGIAHIRAVGPRDGQNFTVTTSDGTVIGQGTRPDELTVTTPATPYDGPINLNYTLNGVAVSAQLGTLRSGAPGRPRPAVGRYDLASILDLSGSMAGTDRGNRRRTAMDLMIQLANPGDRLLAEGFDHERHLVLGRTTITNANKARLRGIAARRIKNMGGTDYNIGFENAYNALTADPLRPEVPKGAIFLTDGASGSIYQNGHLRFAFNGTGTPWPVCVVQLGRSFLPSDVIRLKRIARDTGGVYLHAPNNIQLESLYFQCRGSGSGARTVLRKANTMRVNQRRVFASRVRPKQANATFLVSWSNGRYQLRLFQPGRAKPYTRSQGRKVRLVKGRTFQYFRVNNPRAGRWRLEVRRLPSGGRIERTMTTVNVQRKR